MSELNGITNFKIPGQFEYQGMILGSAYPVDILDKTADFPLINTDTLMASYPKTGTTLLSEIVWLLKNDADVETSEKIPMTDRVPYLSIPDTVIPLFNALKHPRCIQSPVPFKYLPKTVLNGTTKCVYIMRNPKDTLVSFYHFHRASNILGNFWGSWNDFFEYFQRNDCRLLYGNLLDHFLGYWENRDMPNLLVMFYEDVVRDKENSICKIDSFLETNLSKDQINKIVEATSFPSMKKRQTNFVGDKPKNVVPGKTYFVDNKISDFIRKGEIGDWRNYFTEEQNRIVDEMCEKKFAGTGLTFYYG